MDSTDLSLCIADGDWEIVLWPVSIEEDESPSAVLCAVRVRFDHSTGQFAYTARDLYFKFSAFSKLASDLDALAKHDSSECEFCPTSYQLTLTFRRETVRSVSLHINVEEFQPENEPAKMFFSTRIEDFDSLDRMRRRVLSFSSGLAEWISEQQ